MRFFDDDIALRTQHLVLRRLRPDDAAPLFALFNNWNVVRLLSSPPWPYLPEDSRLFVDGSVNLMRDEDNLAITLDGTFVGIIGVRVREANNLQRGAGPNIGYWIGEPFWGRGLMTEALRSFAAQTFRVASGDVIYSGAFTENVASLRVQEKVGFTRDGDTTLFSTPRNGTFAHVNTVLTRARFEQLA